MVEVEQIAIANIYQMLAYAFRALRGTGHDELSAESFDNIHSLFAAILEKGVSVQIKRGLGREYIAYQEATQLPRGKIDLRASFGERASRRLVCRFDMFSENTLANKILKTCLEKLVRLSSDLRPGQPEALRRLLMYFKGVETLDVREIHWQTLSWHRHNASYAMLMQICRLLLQGLLQSDVSGRLRLRRYLDEQEMHCLYEKFIMAYFQREHPGLSVKSNKIDWALDEGCTDFLPAMQTDVVLSSGTRHLVIDAKYYAQPMRKNPYGKNAKIDSRHLYQIYAYVKNMAAHRSGEVGGMLLYARTRDNPVPDADYQMRGNAIKVRSLDLSADWASIRQQLDSVAALVYPETQPLMARTDAVSLDS